MTLHAKTTMPKSLNQVSDIFIFFLNLIILNCGFSTKVTCTIRISTAGTYIELIDGSLSNLEKRQYLSNYWSEKCLRVPLPSLLEGLLKIILKGLYTYLKVTLYLQSVMSDSQWYKNQICQDEWIRYPSFLFDTDHCQVMWRNSLEFNTSQARKPTISSTLLIRYCFKLYRCESGFLNGLSL